jgi:tetratricopeptide (TPR) repeat protein
LSNKGILLISFMILTWLISSTLVVRANPQDDNSKSEVPKVYKLSPPGEDMRVSYLAVGERMLRSRDFGKAREAFESVLELDSQNAEAHYFLGLIEYEEGNLEKAKARFQIAHECLGLSIDTMDLPVNSGQVQLEFPDDYEASVYYKDGWYMKSKDPLAVHRHFYSLDAGSTYRVKLKSTYKYSWARRGMITAFIVAISFLMAR